MNEPPQMPYSYALRVLPRAERDMDRHVARMAEDAGPGIALAWYQGLFTVLASLSQNPGRCAPVNENNYFRKEVRQLLYQRTATSSAWRILFTIEEDAEDAPTVGILHVRHGAQRPITRAEARQIESE